MSSTISGNKERYIPRISLHNFAARKAEISRQIISAAENNGFFILHDQVSPSISDIQEMFSLSEKFFDLPDEAKARTPFKRDENTGWEQLSQVRPSTGLPDQKESIQLQYHRRHDETWPSDPALPANFKEKLEKFMETTHALSMDILSIFALALGFEEDFFRNAHQVHQPDALSTLRLLHYHAAVKPFPKGYWRAGAHTDFDCLTLLFQKTGEDGLEICPGREAHTSFGHGDEWTEVKACTGEIACNIGDMLMAWSDDRFKSLFHRVRPPTAVEGGKGRYSIAYFNQANKDVKISGPRGKYPVLTAHQYILDASKRNYGQIEKMLEEREKEQREK
ncbi:hypothetical protein RUND412_002186 [Rhizina undulata]